MNLWLRLLYVLLTGAFRKRLEILETSVLKLMVFANDLDLYGHMNNGRYLTLMDLGRIDLIRRSGFGEIAFKNRWNPLVSTVKIVYKKPLFLFQTFELRTRILGWDEKWFYLEQTFVGGNKEVYALGQVKGLFRGKDGNIPSSKILKLAGMTHDGSLLSRSVQDSLSS